MRPLLAAVLIACAAAANARDRALNPGFEMGTYGANVPEHWAVAGDDVTFALDSAYAHTGRKSARISREASHGTAGLVQTIDAKPFAGKTVMVRAWFRREGAAEAAIGLASSGREAAQRRSSAFPVPQAPAGEWIEARGLLDVPVEASRVAFAAMLRSGTLWVDSFDLLDADSLPAASPPAKVTELVDEAIAKLRTKALHADRVDWQRARSRSLLLVSGDGPGASHASVIYLVTLLADPRSYFVLPDRAEDMRGGGPTGADHIQGRAIRKLGYVAVPGFAGVKPERGKGFADQVRATISAIPAACGWIVDLRGNRGGNAGPMVAGLADFLDEGRLRNLPVAVLIGPNTYGAGEATLVSFIGRPQTRTFGVPTAGRSTAAEFVELSDGSGLWISTAVLADRQGRTYGGKISPDELVLGETGAAKDGVVDAAAKWLESQPGCAGISEPPGTATR